LALALALGAPASTAADYPDRPIRMIVPWAAGGDTDAIFRPFAPLLQKHAGQPVIVANIAGASGSAGAREAKDAPADGYTLFAVADYVHATYYTGVSEINFWDFDPVCSIASTPAVLTAGSTTTWRTWAVLHEDALRRPGEITVGATLGSTSHFFPALIEKVTGIKFKYVGYDGLAPRMNAVLGGRVDLTAANLTQRSQAEAGMLRFLAIASEQRHPEIPSVPTLKELGINIVFEMARGVMVPKGTPEPVRSHLEKACARAASEPAFAETMKALGTRVRHLGGPDFAKFLADNDAMYKNVAHDVGMLRR
jgi:tripartite-type tricarboxylate transporter receptor subunit TctC